VSPIAWIYVLWCLVGGILGAVIAQSKNRKTWQGALLGVLLGLIGVLIVALLPKLPERSSVGRASGDPIGPVRQPAAVPDTGPSVSDAILQLAALRDDGVISPEEFESKKNELLDGLATDPRNDEAG
jgi:hypothetical protein